jgi:hypothetical protein
MQNTNLLEKAHAAHERQSVVEGILWLLAFTLLVMPASALAGVNTNTYSVIPGIIPRMTRLLPMT